MKNILNKVLVLLLVLFVGLSVTACNKDNDTTNKNVPFGTLSESTIIANVGNIKLSQKELYNKMRVSGYDYLIDELVRVLINPDQYLTADKKAVKDDVKDDIKKLVQEQCYGTSDEESLDKMNSSTKETYRNKFVDNMRLIGISATNTEEGIYSDSVLVQFANQYAQKKYVENILRDKNNKYYWENEKYTNDEGKEVSNPFYISEDAIESAYNSDKDADSTYNVVIVGYETLAQAQAAVAGKDINNLTANDLVELYKNRYSYKFGNEEYTIDNDYFKLTDAQLSKYNSSLVSLIKNIDEENEGKFTAKAFQQFGDTVYFVGVQGKKAVADYSALEGEAKTKAKEETLNEIIESKLTSSVVSTILFENLYESEVVIYDYVFDALYSVENAKHTRLEAKQWQSSFNNTVATINGTAISVETFYNKLYPLLGVSTTLDYFTNKVVLEKFGSKVTDKETKANNEDLDAILESFNNDELASSGLPKSIGEDAFKFLYFGTTNMNEIKEHYKAQTAWEHYKKSKPENYYNLIEKFGKNYVGYTNEDKDPYNGQFFDLSVKHILLTVDYNGDGTPDDPEIFCQEANVNKADLETAVKETMRVIAEEVHYLVGEHGYASLEDALDFILKQYYKNGTVHHRDNSTWDQHKSQFHFGLTIEDLGSVNNSSVSQYVKEFGIGTQKLYEQLKNSDLLDEDFLIAEIKATEEGKTPIAVTDNDLIQTTYGYHVLAVYNSGSITSAKYTSSSDSGENYKSIDITLDDNELTLDAYSDNEWASLNQIKIYVAQVNTDDGVTDLPSSVKTFISNIYTNFISRYDADKFRSILFAETYLNIEFVGADAQAETANYKEFIEIQKRQFDSYEDYSATSNSIFADWWKLIHETPENLAK